MPLPLLHDVFALLSRSGALTGRLPAPGLLCRRTHAPQRTLSAVLCADVRVCHELEAAVVLPHAGARVHQGEGLHVRLLSLPLYCQSL
jgi:hypothetical protein